LPEGIMIAFSNTPLMITASVFTDKET